MNVVTVTPINKGIFKDTLTYWSVQDIPLGAIVTVPVRERTIEALVVESRDAASLKTQIKGSDFSLKKVAGIQSNGLFLPAFLSACAETADFHAATLGQTIKAALPQAILERLSDSKHIPLEPEPEKEPDGDNTIKQNKFILQDDDEGRISYYKSWIRESFAKKQSVFLCLPAVADIEKYAASFGQGIKDYTIILHAELSKTALRAAWNKALSLGHPILVIATPSFLSLPRGDIRTVIIEKEASSAYKSLSRPRIDFRFLAEKFADSLGARFILGDLVLRAETIFKSERGDYAHLSGLKYRSMSEAEQFIFDNKAGGEKQGSAALGDDLRELVRFALEHREKVVILSGRKGLAPSTICNDCGGVVHCSRCQSPLVLHKDKTVKKYVYACHKCGAEEEVRDACDACGSWRLALLGSGIEKVEEELRELFPEAPVFRLDADSVKPSKRAELVAKFYGTKGGAILLGTELLLYHLDEKVPNAAAVALDALFSLPDFRVSEKMLGLLLRFRQYASKRFAIQTRNPGEKVWSYAIRGNLIDFYREEIEERMAFGYPPFKVLVKVSREGRPEETEKDMEKLEEVLADWKPVVYPSPASGAKGRLRLHALFKMNPARWPHAGMLAALKSLPPSFEIDAEPESIL